MGTFTKNINLEMPNENERYSINVFNTNAEKIDAALMRKGRDEYWIAGPYSPERFMEAADVRCETEEEFAPKLQDIIDSMEEGDTLRICPGYYLMTPETSEGIVINERIRVLGFGMNVSKIANMGIGGIESNCRTTFTIKSEFAVLGNMMLADPIECVKSSSMVDIMSNSVELRDLFFVENAASVSTCSCVRLLSDSNYTRIEDCRIYRRTSSPQRPMLDFADHDFANGVIGSIIISGNDSLSIKYKNDRSKNSTAIYGCSDVVYL